MTQEDKELLLKDLCARLPYGVKMNHIANNDNEPTTLIGIVKDMITLEGNGGYSTANVEEFKPYLLPFSSLTDEQYEELKQEYTNIACDNIKKMFANPNESHLYSSKSSSFEIDWLNRHQIDYRGLIPMGLAIDATGLNIY